MTIHIKHSPQHWDWYACESNWRLSLMPAHSIYEIWDQSNSSSMDHITNQALLHLLPYHAPHCYLGYDFWVVTGLLRGHGFVQLEIRHIVLFLLSFRIDFNVKVKNAGSWIRDEITMALSVCYTLVTNETVLISEDIISISFPKVD